MRQLGGSVALAALMVTLIGIGSLVTNIPASLITTRYGERWAIVGAGVWGALAMALCVFALEPVGLRRRRASWSACRPPCSAWRARAISPRRCRSATARARLSTLGGVMRIGLFLGPFLAAALIHAMGIGGAYWAGVGALVARRRWSRCACPTCRRTRACRRGGAARRCRAPATLRSIGAGHARIFLTVGIGALLVSRGARVAPGGDPALGRGHRPRRARRPR